MCGRPIKKFFINKIQELRKDAAATKGSPGDTCYAAKCTNVPHAPSSKACGDSETSNKALQRIRVCSSGHNSSTSSVAAVGDVLSSNYETAETAAGCDRRAFIMHYLAMPVMILSDRHRTVRAWMRCTQEYHIHYNTIAWTHCQEMQAHAHIPHALHANSALRMIAVRLKSYKGP